MEEKIELKEKKPRTEKQIEAFKKADLLDDGSEEIKEAKEETQEKENYY